MPTPTQDTGAHTQLRFNADARLKQGTAPPTKGWALSAEALTVLYKLASNPDSAGEGLKLLHELQAHQVELDLQHEQLEANERQFTEELTRYRTLFDAAPVGYFVVQFDGQIIESNLAGAKLLGVGQDEPGGRSISSLLAPESRPALDGLLKKLHYEGGDASCAVLSRDRGTGSSQWQITASVAPGNAAILMIVAGNAP